jgi:hypothetical protein
VFGIFPHSDFDCSDDDSFVMNAPSFAARPPTDKALVNLDGIFAADAIALWPNHASPQLVKNLERGFVASQAKLPLKLQGGLSGRLGGNEISTPEPG